MARSSLENRNIRKLCKVGGGKDLLRNPADRSDQGAGLAEEAESGRGDRFEE